MKVTIQSPMITICEEEVPRHSFVGIVWTQENVLSDPQITKISPNSNCHLKSAVHVLAG